MKRWRWDSLGAFLLQALIAGILATLLIAFVVPAIFEWLGRFIFR